MKKFLLAAMMLVFVSGIASAQRYCANTKGNGFGHSFPKPHGCVIPHKPTAAIVSYNAASTTLTVKFCQISQSNTVEVYRDGAKVAGITTKGSTTFSCRLREYGAGNYTVIVSNGKTVVETKNYTVR